MSRLLLNVSSSLSMFFLSSVSRVIIWWAKLARTCSNEEVFFSRWALMSWVWIHTHQGELNVSTESLGQPRRWAPASPEEASWPLLAASSRKFCACPGPYEGAGRAFGEKVGGKEDWYPAKTSVGSNPKHMVWGRGSLASLGTRNECRSAVICKFTS